MKKWKDLTLYEKGKKIAKYTLNVLNIINFLIIGINSVEGVSIPYYTQIVGIMAVVMSAISTYLLGDKAKSKMRGE